MSGPTFLGISRAVLIFTTGMLRRQVSVVLPSGGVVTLYSTIWLSYWQQWPQVLISGSPTPQQYILVALVLAAVRAMKHRPRPHVNATRARRTRLATLGSGGTPTLQQCGTPSSSPSPTTRTIIRVVHQGTPITHIMEFRRATAPVSTLMYPCGLLRLWTRHGHLVTLAPHPPQRGLCRPASHHVPPTRTTRWHSSHCHPPRTRHSRNTRDKCPTQAAQCLKHLKQHLKQLRSTTMSGLRTAFLTVHQHTHIEGLHLIPHPLPFPHIPTHMTMWPSIQTSMIRSM